MTYLEVIDEIKAFNRRQNDEFKNESRLRAAMDYRLGQLIGIAFNEPKKYPKSLSKAYPNLFESESQSSSWREQKERFSQFAKQHNQGYQSDKD